MAQNADEDVSMQEVDAQEAQASTSQGTRPKRRTQSGGRKRGYTEEGLGAGQTQGGDGKDTTMMTTSFDAEAEAPTNTGVKAASPAAFTKESTPLLGKVPSTTPSKEVTDRFAPGSAPYWLGAGTGIGAAVAGAMLSSARRREAPSAGPDAAEGEASTDGSIVKKEQDELDTADATDGKAEAVTVQAAVAGPLKQSTTNLARSLPVKRYDSEALTRADLQHNILTRIFGDSKAVFRNARPGPTGPAGSASWKTPVPSYPPGNAREAARRSDETEDEYAKYDKERKAFEDVPFDDEAKQRSTDEEGKEVAVTPDTLRPRKGLPRAGSVNLTFKELYIEQLVHSGKCTKAMREKLIADEAFAEDFAKVCLLVNVGRINTTLAFYPEMKTILRSYHPLPSLQRTESTQRNLQDAPRMKSLLKSVLLDDEKAAGSAAATSSTRTAKSSAGSTADKNDAPTSLSEVALRQQRDSDSPPTSAVNLLFILITHNSEVTSMHFEHPHDFFTIFFPHPEVAVPSAQRAQAFLWLMWHYLEGGALLPPGSKPNPFDDDISRKSAQDARGAWDALSAEEQDKIKIRGYWTGIKNPAYIEYKRQQTEGTVADGEASALSSEIPAEYLHRMLCPKLDSISFQESAKENVDSAEEYAFAEKMKEERRQFLVKFQEEEQAKVAEEHGTPVGDETNLDDGASKGKGKDKAGKKRASHIGGGSSYPLANILAAANAEKAAAAAAAAASSAEGETRKAKRARRDGSSAVVDASDEDGEGPSFDKADTLWDLDLTLPAHLAPRNGLLKVSGAATGAATTAQAEQSLPRIAWRRILERAQRGVGDASYESDDEDVARDEAMRDERPRAELARILACLRDVRTHRGNIIRPVAADKGAS